MGGQPPYLVSHRGRQALLVVASFVELGWAQRKNAAAKARVIGDSDASSSNRNTNTGSEASHPSCSSSSSSSSSSITTTPSSPSSHPDMDDDQYHTIRISNVGTYSHNRTTASLHGETRPAAPPTASRTGQSMLDNRTGVSQPTTRAPPTRTMSRTQTMRPGDSRGGGRLFGSCSSSSSPSSSSYPPSSSTSSSSDTTLFGGASRSLPNPTTTTSFSTNAIEREGERKPRSLTRTRAFRPRDASGAFLPGGDDDDDDDVDDDGMDGWCAKEAFGGNGEMVVLEFCPPEEVDGGEQEEEDDDELDLEFDLDLYDGEEDDEQFEEDEDEDDDEEEEEEEEEEEDPLDLLDDEEDAEDDADLDISRMVDMFPPIPVPKTPASSPVTTLEFSAGREHHVVRVPGYDSTNVDMHMENGTMERERLRALIDVSGLKSKKSKSAHANKNNSDGNVGSGTLSRRAARAMMPPALRIPIPQSRTRQPLKGLVVCNPAKPVLSAPCSSSTTSSTSLPFSALKPTPQNKTSKKVEKGCNIPGLLTTSSPGSFRNYEPLPEEDQDQDRTQQVAREFEFDYAYEYNNFEPEYIDDDETPVPSPNVERCEERERVWKLGQQMHQHQYQHQQKEVDPTALGALRARGREVDRDVGMERRGVRERGMEKERGRERSIRSVG
ncbi:hypothetical protein D9613_009634 [Agrocybe pediades]|uniref:Uncharacterized protein n=1 Tax=Agrocybe pediades TaxID=84607 RepID=A0A8H4VUC2_9AGAR|nr:hypothetical protein D9613_009634 [Agrocybe pediades]